MWSARMAPLREACMSPKQRCCLPLPAAPPVSPVVGISRNMMIWFRNRPSCVCDARQSDSHSRGMQPAAKWIEYDRQHKCWVFEFTKSAGSLQAQGGVWKGSRRRVCRQLEREKQVNQQRYQQYTEAIQNMKAVIQTTQTDVWSESDGEMNRFNPWGRSWTPFRRKEMKSHSRFSNNSNQYKIF